MKPGQPFLIILVVLGLALPALARGAQAPLAPRELRFERLTIADGLSQSTVTAIFQDQRGFMWFGTASGLNRYDGYQFIAYKHDRDDPATLLDNQVNAVYEDGQGELWVGTNLGLDRLNRENGAFTHHVHDPGDEGGLSVGAVLSIHEDSAGTLWVGTSRGLNRYDRATQTFDRYLDNISARVIYPGERGTLWIGSNSGLLHFYPTTETFDHYQHDPGDPASLSDDRVQAIFQAQDGALWVGTDGGGLDKLFDQTFTHYRHDPGDEHSLSDDRVQAILQDGQGRLWIGTSSGLDLFVDQGRFVHSRHAPTNPHSLSDDLVHALYEDRSGVLWIGTHGGLSKYSPAANRFELYQQGPGGLSHNLVQAVYEDRDGALWVGTFAGGLDRLALSQVEGLDRTRQTLTNYRHDPGDPASLSSDDVRAIYQDADGVLWVGTDQGLDQFDPQAETFAHHPDLSGSRVTVIRGERSGNLWIGTSAGLYRLERATGDLQAFDAHGLSGNYVSAIYQYRGGDLWVGTFGGGLNPWDEASGRFISYRRDASGLSSDVVLSIHQDPQGIVWVGTEGGGLERFDPSTQAFTRYTEQDGLPGDSVNCILNTSTALGVNSAEGQLWLGANRGLARFDLAAETFYSYDGRDGLQGGEFIAGACYQGQSGEMFFGGFQGLNAFYPARIELNPHAPPLLITALDPYDQSVHADLLTDEHLQLSYQDNDVSFQFTALDYVAPARNQYAYKMDGVDEDWRQAGTNRRADYANLRAGDYVLRVRASNSDGIWSEEYTIRVSVTPPPWETWWFRGGALLALALGLAGAYRLRVRNIQAQKRALQARVEQRTAELSETNVLLRQEMDERQRAEQALAQQAAQAAVAAERNRLARDMHDSVTQSLYSLTLLSAAGQRMIEARDLPQIQGNQARLSEISQQALQEMRLLVYELRPLALQSTGLVGALEQRLEAVERRAGINARLITSGQEIGVLPPQVEQELYRIAQEALNNALKHAGASAVTVHVMAQDGTLALEISDDGRGFDPQAVSSKGGLGQTSMRERAAKIGALLTINSAPGAGTRVQVVVAQHTTRNTLYGGPNERHHTHPHSR